MQHETKPVSGAPNGELASAESPALQHDDGPYICVGIGRRIFCRVEANGTIVTERVE